MNLTQQNVFQLDPGEARSTEFIRDESLASGTAGTCDLFIAVESGQSTFALKERKSNRFLALESLSLPVLRDDGAPLASTLQKAALKSRVLSERQFSRVRIAAAYPDTLLVPEALFRTGDEKNYLDFNLGRTEGREYRSESMIPFQARILYRPEAQLESVVSCMFSDAQIHPHLSGLLRSVQLHFRNQSGRNAFLHIRQDAVDLIITEGNKLLLVNAFSWQNKEDVLYYLLFAFEQLELNPETVPVHLAGTVLENSGIHTLLIRYIRHLRFASRPESAGVSFAFQHVPAQAHYSLFSLPLCES